MPASNHYVAYVRRWAYDSAASSSVWWRCSDTHIAGPRSNVRRCSELIRRNEVVRFALFELAVARAGGGGGGGDSDASGSDADSAANDSDADSDGGRGGIDIGGGGGNTFVESGLELQRRQQQEARDAMLARRPQEDDLSLIHI